MAGVGLGLVVAAEATQAVYDASSRWLLLASKVEGRYDEHIIKRLLLRDMEYVKDDLKALRDAHFDAAWESLEQWKASVMGRSDEGTLFNEQKLRLAVNVERLRRVMEHANLATKQVRRSRDKLRAAKMEVFATFFYTAVAVQPDAPFNWLEARQEADMLLGRLLNAPYVQDAITRELAGGFANRNERHEVLMEVSNICCAVDALPCPFSYQSLHLGYASSEHKSLWLAIDSVRRAREGSPRRRRSRSSGNLSCFSDRNYCVALRALSQYGLEHVSSAEVATLDGHRDSVRTLDVYQTGQGGFRTGIEEGNSSACTYAATGSFDGTIRVWDMNEGSCIRVLGQPEEDISSKVLCVAIYGVQPTYTTVPAEAGGGVDVTESLFAISGSKDAVLRLWSVSSGRCDTCLHGHNAAVMDVKVYYVGCANDTRGTEGMRCISASEDRCLRMWDLHASCCLRTLRGHQEAVWCVSLFRDGRGVGTKGMHAVSGSFDKTLKVWDLHEATCTMTLQGHSQWVQCVDVYEDPELGRRACSGSWDGTLRVWDVATGRCVFVLKGHSDYVTAVRVFDVAAGTGRSGAHAVSGSVDKTLKVWDLGQAQCLRTLDAHAKSIWCVAVYRLGGANESGSWRAMSGSQDGQVKVWLV